MILNIAEETYAPKEYDFEGGKLNVRVAPSGNHDVILEGKKIILSGEDRWKTFDYALVGWSGYQDKNGKEIPFTDEIKRKVFDYNIGGIARKVAEINAELVNKLGEQEKN